MPMPKKSHQEQYQEDHQRNICPGCQLWVLWYHDKKGKEVFGCEIGEIPYKDECPAHKGKRRAQ
ncbi:unnamed protein product [marine sediment metagenome]|uniref:Uncharacterized protein n=1 Tax=marine sediment metagenome TaxID=412755 RepID=X1NZ69_9ZZZZ